MRYLQKVHDLLLNFYEHYKDLGIHIRLYQECICTHLVLYPHIYHNIHLLIQYMYLHMHVFLSSPIGPK